MFKRILSTITETRIKHAGRNPATIVIDFYIGLIRRFNALTNEIFEKSKPRSMRKK